MALNLKNQMETRNIDAVLVKTITSREFRDRAPEVKDAILQNINSFRDRMGEISNEITLKEIRTFTDKVSDDLKNLELDGDTKIDLLTATFKDLVNAAMNKTKQFVKRHLEKKRSGVITPKKGAVARKPVPQKKNIGEDVILKANLTARYSTIISEYKRFHTEFNPGVVSSANEIPKDLAHTLRFKAFLDEADGDKTEAEKLMDNEICRAAAAAALAKHLPGFKGIKSFFAHVAKSFRKSDWADKLAQA